MTTTHGWAIWLTGLPAAGKTTLAQGLRNRLCELGIATALLDTDELRPILAPGAAYSATERDEFYLRLVRLAGLLTRDGVNVVIAATGNRRAHRECAARVLAPFAEVWVRCPLELCRERDPKGLYAAAATGAITDLPGAGAAYEPPLAPAATVDTDRQSVAEAVEAILAGVPFIGEEVWTETRS
jgi:adenylyl-sulfate kinase